jgi:hypothetical protein
LGWKSFAHKLNEIDTRSHELISLILHLDSVVAGLLLEFAAMSKSGEKGLSGGTPNYFGRTGSNPHVHAKHVSLPKSRQGCPHVIVHLDCMDKLS